MPESQGYSYQIFETYFQQGKEAQEAGRMNEAKKMYLHAAEALLRCAKTEDGETKEALVRRAKKLMLLSDGLPSVPDGAVSKPGKNSDGMGAAADKDRVSRRVRDKDQDESETMWQCSGNPGIHFDDIAGLNDVKETIRSRIILPREHPEVYSHFHRKSEGGILLYGPPGTGKTMMAEAVATEIEADFYSIRCSDIVGKYFGEAEKNVKNLFETARSSKNAIIFFDEFEALAAKRGGNSTVMNRLVPELLSQIDGFSDNNNSNLLIIAATNRPWDIDSAFLRPPRLTEKIYVGLPDYDARLYMAQKEFKSVPCEMENIGEMIAEATEGCNSADVVSICGKIKDSAIRNTLENNEKSGIVRYEDADAALRNCRSSVQKSDLEKIEQWEKSQSQS